MPLKLRRHKTIVDKKIQPTNIIDLYGPTKNKLVVIDNCLISARFPFTQQTLLLWMYALTKIYRKGDRLKGVEIECKEFEKHIGYPLSKAEYILRCQKLMDNHIIIKTKTGQYHEEFVVRSFTYTPRKIQIEFNPTMAEYLIHLTSCFTQFKFPQFAKLKGYKYADRWYLIGSQYKNLPQGYKNMTGNQIREIHGLGSSQYTRERNLRNFIVNKPLLLITEKTDLNMWAKRTQNGYEIHTKRKKQK